MDNALDRGSDESQSPSLFTDAEEAKLSPDVPPISISQAGYGLSTTQDGEASIMTTRHVRQRNVHPVSSRGEATSLESTAGLATQAEGSATSDSNAHAQALAQQVADMQQTLIAQTQILQNLMEEALNIGVSKPIITGENSSRASDPLHEDFHDFRADQTPNGNPPEDEGEDGTAKVDPSFSPNHNHTIFKLTSTGYGHGEQTNEARIPANSTVLGHGEHENVKDAVVDPLSSDAAARRGAAAQKITDAPGDTTFTQVVQQAANSHIRSNHTLEKMHEFSNNSSKTSNSEAVQEATLSRKAGMLRENPAYEKIDSNKLARKLMEVLLDPHLTHRKVHDGIRDLFLSIMDTLAIFKAENQSEESKQLFQSIILFDPLLMFSKSTMSYSKRSRDLHDFASDSDNNDPGGFQRLQMLHQQFRNSQPNVLSQLSNQFCASLSSEIVTRGDIEDSERAALDALFATMTLNILGSGRFATRLIIERVVALQLVFAAAGEAVQKALTLAVEEAPGNRYVGSMFNKMGVFLCKRQYEETSYGRVPNLLFMSGRQIPISPLTVALELDMRPAVLLLLLMGATREQGGQSQLLHARIYMSRFPLWMHAIGHHSAEDLTKDVLLRAWADYHKAVYPDSGQNTALPTILGYHPYNGEDVPMVIALFIDSIHQIMGTSSPLYG